MPLRLPGALLLGGLLGPVGPAPALAMRRSEYAGPEERESGGGNANEFWGSLSPRYFGHSMLSTLNATLPTLAVLQRGESGHRPLVATFALLERGAQRQVGSALHCARTDLEEHPEYAFVVVWFVIFAVCVLRIWLASGAEFEVQSKEARSRRDRLHGTYASATAEIEGILASLSESAVSLAEWNFNEKRRVFIRGLERINSAPKKYFPSSSKETVDAFRNFVFLWLRIFEECTEDPVERPRGVVERRELEGCRRIQDVAKLVSDRLQRCPVDFLRHDGGGLEVSQHVGRQSSEEAVPKPWLRIFWGFGCGRRSRCPDQPASPMKARERDSSDAAANAHARSDGYPQDFAIGCLQVTLLSNTHVFALGTYLVGIPLLVLEIVLRCWFFATVVGIAEAYLVYGLYQIRDYDEICILEEEIAHLEKVSQEVTQHRSQLAGFYVNIREVNTLWQYRTLPALELLDAVAELVLQECDPMFLRDITVASSRIVDGLGDVSLYMEGRLPEGVLNFAAEELKAATDFLHERRGLAARAAALERLNRIFGAAVVRVHGAKGLGGRGLQGLSKIIATMCPIVTVSVNDGHRHRGLGRPDLAAFSSPFRTERVKSSSDPRWEDEEFLIPIVWRGTHLQLHVWDAHLNAEPTSLGFHIVDLDCLTRGAWHHLCGRLRSAKNGDELPGEIEFQVYFADEIRQLASDSAPALTDLKRISEPRR